MKILCRLFGHQDADPHVKVRYTLRSSSVILTLTCPRCHTSTQTIFDQRYDFEDLAVLLQIRDYANAYSQELEAMWRLEAGE